MLSPESVLMNRDDLEAYVQDRISKAWPMLAEAHAYQKARADQLQASFEAMAAQLNARYVASRPKHSSSS